MRLLPYSLLASLLLSNVLASAGPKHYCYHSMLSPMESYLKGNEAIRVVDHAVCSTELVFDFNARSVGSVATQAELAATKPEDVIAFQGEAPTKNDLKDVEFQRNNEYDILIIAYACAKFPVKVEGDTVTACNHPLYALEEAIKQLYAMTNFENDREIVKEYYARVMMPHKDDDSGPNPIGVCIPLIVVPFIALFSHSVFFIYRFIAVSRGDEKFKRFVVLQ